MNGRRDRANTDLLHAYETIFVDHLLQHGVRARQRHAEEDGRQSRGYSIGRRSVKSASQTGLEVGAIALRVSASEGHVRYYVNELGTRLFVDQIPQPHRKEVAKLKKKHRSFFLINQALGLSMLVYCRF